MYQYGVFQILFIEFLMKIGQYHHREFQTLGLVDTHDLHAAGGLIGAKNRRLFPFQQVMQMLDKIEQAHLACSRLMFGIAGQRQQVVLSCLAAVHCAENGDHMAGVIYLPDQSVHRQVAAVLTQGTEHRQKIRRLFLPVQLQGVVKITLPPQ